MSIFSFLGKTVGKVASVGFNAVKGAIGAAAQKVQLTVKQEPAAQPQYIPQAAVQPPQPYTSPIPTQTAAVMGEKSNTMLYVGIGAGALVLLATVYFVSRR